VDEYITLFSEAFAKGCNEIISLHPDQRLSRSYERALAAAKALPQLPIRVIDTQLMSIGLRYILEQVTPQMSALEIQALIKQWSGSITEFVLLGSLDHLSLAQDTLGSMLFSYVPILQHTAKEGLLPVARLDSLELALKYLNENIQGFSQYRAGFSSLDFYKRIKPKLKKLTMSTADQYSSVLMANFGSKLFGVAALR
jgi:fatty acid-binding protein DegV